MLLLARSAPAIVLGSHRALQLLSFSPPTRPASLPTPDSYSNANPTAVGSKRGAVGRSQRPAVHRPDRRSRAECGASAPPYDLNKLGSSRVRDDSSSAQPAVSSFKEPWPADGVAIVCGPCPCLSPDSFHAICHNTSLHSCTNIGSIGENVGPVRIK